MVYLIIVGECAMKRKNYLLIVISVLMVAIGVAFGYYVSKIFFTGDTTPVKIETAIINDIEISFVPSSKIALELKKEKYIIFDLKDFVNKMKVE